MGVDGIITNFPSNLRDVLKEDDISKQFKLATFKDNPWEKYIVLNNGKENLTDFINETEVLKNS